MIEYILVPLICVLFWLIYQFRSFESLIKHIPGPPTIPLIGNGLLFLGKSPEDTFKTITGVHQKYGDIFRIFVGTKLVIAVIDPKDVEFILSSQSLLEKADEYNPIKEWLGNGLLISNGRKWFSRRKVLTPAFHFKILEEFVEIFDKNSATFVNNLEKFEGQEVDVFPFVTLLALDVICETSMGVKIHAQTNSESEYVKAVKDISSIITLRHYNFLLRSNWIFKLSPLYQKQRKTLKILHGFVNNVIVSRRKELVKQKVQVGREIEDDVGCKRKLALLDVLLQSEIDGKPLTNMDIREEVNTFMFEGEKNWSLWTALKIFSFLCRPRHDNECNSLFLIQPRKISSNPTKSFQRDKEQHRRRCRLCCDIKRS
jgi:cytochrome P450 family 4